MSERTRYLYKLVKSPAFYRWFQDLLGAQQGKRNIVERFVKPPKGGKVLDVGCGPGTFRPFLGDVKYTGIDFNENHIELAREKGQPGDTYIVGNVVTDIEFKPKSFDRIVLLGLLHHIDDAGARILLERVAGLVKPDGWITTTDGVYIPGQRKFAKMMLDRDSGKNIRMPEKYKELCEGLPLEVETVLLQDNLRIPYDHNVMLLRPSK